MHLNPKHHHNNCCRCDICTYYQHIRCETYSCEREWFVYDDEYFCINCYKEIYNESLGFGVGYEKIFINIKFYGAKEKFHEHNINLTNEVSKLLDKKLKNNDKNLINNIFSFLNYNKCNKCNKFYYITNKCNNCEFCYK